MSTDYTESLAQFGSEFQMKCMAALIYDRAFLEQSLDIINPKFFDSTANQWIMERLAWYFEKYKSSPSGAAFQKEVNNIPKHDDLRKAVRAQLLLIFNNGESDDLQYVKDEFLKFCKNQAIKSAILKSADMLEMGNYDNIKSLIDKAMNAGVERNIGHDYHNDIEIRTSKVTRNTIATPWEAINAITDGGLGAGELGCVVAPSGVGKSWLLIALGAHAMRLGKRVVHYTFELQENYVGLRYDTVFTQIAPQLVRDNIDAVRSAMENIPGELTVKYFPQRSVSVTAIRAHVNRMITLGKRPDLILIDYADLMLPVTRAEAQHQALQFIHEEIRGMLGELRIPGWTASQSQRSSTQDDIVEGDKISGSFGKIMTDDFVMSASRKVADKLSSTGRVHIIKNRNGPDGQTFPAKMDLAKGDIGIYEENSPAGIRIKAQMTDAGHQIQAVMARKLIDHRKTPQEPMPHDSPDLVNGLPDTINIDDLDDWDNVSDGAVAY